MNKVFNKIKKTKFFLTLVLSFIVLGLAFTNLSYAKNDKDVIKDIIKNTDSSVCEYGVTTSFEAKEDGQRLCNKIISSLKMDKDIKNLSKKDNLYSCEFKKGELEGSIDATLDGEKTIITLTMRKKDNSCNLESFKKEIETLLDNLGYHVKSFQYIKAVLKNNDIIENNNIVLNTLKVHGASNLDNIKTVNAFNTTAFTGDFQAVRCGNSYIDFSCAVCSYSNRSYLIIGIPEIIVTY